MEFMAWDGDRVADESVSLVGLVFGLPPTSLEALTFHWILSAGL